MIKRLCMLVGAAGIALFIVSGMNWVLDAADQPVSEVASATRLAMPIITSVTPNSAPNNVDTTLVISGSAFMAELTGTIIIQSPRVFLDDTLLAQAKWVSTTVLTAVVPWGLDAGVYTLTVRNPDGSSGRMTNAFTVEQAIGVWTTSGPYGGSIFDIAVHPVQTQTVFTVVPFAGLYQSHNGGQNWEHTSLGPGDRFCRVTYGAASPNTLYTWGSIGIWSSEDDGITWQAVYTQGGGFAQHPTNPNILYISRGDGEILRSQDGGENWEDRSLGMAVKVHTMLIDPVTPTILFVTTNASGIYKSTDEGLHWVSADSGLEKDIGNIYTLVMNPFDTDNLWALGGQFYRSDNGAQSWITVPITYEVPWALTFSPILSGTLYAGAGHELLVSSNSGEDWGLFSQTIFDGMIYQIRLDPLSGRPIYIGNNNGGFYRSLDQGKTWEKAIQGITGLEPRAVVPAPSKPHYVYLSTNDGAFYSNNSGQSWIESKGGPQITAVDPTNHLIAYGVLGVGQIGKTLDGGKTWMLLTVSDDPDRYVSTLTLYPTQTQMLLAGGGDHWPDFAHSRGWLARSEDGGVTWAELPVGRIISEVTSIVIDPFMTNTLHIGTGTIHPYIDYDSNGGVYKSIDGGLTWNPVLESGCVRDLVLHPENHQVLFAAINDPAPGAVGVYQSIDGGENWEPRNVGLETGRVLELAIDPVAPSHLYAATWQGFFYSLNDGQNWQRAPQPFGSIPVLAVGIAATNDLTFLYIGTAGGELTSRTTYAQANNRLWMVTDGFIDAGVYQTTIDHRRDETPLRVCPTGCLYTSVQAAVDAAQDGDLIQVAVGTYADAHPRPTPADYVGPAIITQVLYITKTVTVQGGYNATFDVQDPDGYPTILDAGGQGRGIVAVGEGTTLTLEGLRVTGGVAAGLGGEEPETDAGGGVYVYSATLTMNDCQVFSNTAESGGGVWLRGSPVANLRRNAILNNTADIAAGLFVLQVSEVVLDENTIEGNMASDMMGGGMVFWGDKVRLTENLIQGNLGVNNGGGFWLDGNTDVVVQNNTVLSNTSDYCGGICFQGPYDASNITVQDNHIQGNTQGGLVFWGYGEPMQVTVSHNLIQGNSVAGIYANSMDTEGDTLLLEGNTIQGNLGNGVMVQFGFSPQLYGNTILSNTTGSGAGLYFDNVANVVLSHNLIRGNSATEDGGGIYASGCSVPALDANVIAGNVAQGKGAGLYLEAVTGAILDNSVIADNRGGATGSGVYLDASTAIFRHTTLARNSSSGFISGDGSGLSLQDSDVILTNTVLVSHTVGITGTSSYPVILDSVLWYGNGANVGGAAVINATGQITANPVFATDGYHLLYHSAAIDAGIDSGPATDIDGDPRLIGAAPDLGADEYTFITLVPDYIRPAHPGDKVNYRHTLTNDTTEALIFDLTAHSSQDWEVVLYVSGYPSSTLQLPYTLAAGESTLVTVSIQVPPDALGLIDTTVVTATAVGHPTLWAAVTDITRASALIYLPLVLRNG